MYILFLPGVGLYVSFLTLANAQGKASWHKGLRTLHHQDGFIFYTRDKYTKVISTLHHQDGFDLCTCL
jgi:hypothetical protein